MKDRDLKDKKKKGVEKVKQTEQDGKCGKMMKGRELWSKRDTEERMSDKNGTYVTTFYIHRF